ncbi:MAG: hypothetical protein R2850_01365 [Bacteroidia bacterium]
MPDLTLKQPLKNAGCKLENGKPWNHFHDGALAGCSGCIVLPFMWLGSMAFGEELFGRVDFSHEGFALNRIEDLTQGQFDPESFNIPSVPVVLSLILISAVIAGATINLIFALGEEIGLAWLYVFPARTFTGLQAHHFYRSHLGFLACAIDSARP